MGSTYVDMVVPRGVVTDHASFVAKQCNGLRRGRTEDTCQHAVVRYRFREGAGPIKFQLRRVTCDEQQQRASVEWNAVMESREQEIVGVSVLQFQEAKISETAVYRQTT